MSKRFFERVQDELADLSSAQLLRTITPLPDGAIDLSSNDYLGLSVNPELHERVVQRMQSLPLSASSSRLLPGYHAEHECAEASFAEFLGAPSTLMFNSGYDANVALLAALATRHDLILYDDRSHASWYDGTRATLGQSYKFRHNSVEHVEELLNAHRAKFKQVFIIIESIYSMDGDLSPLVRVAEIAHSFDAILLVDEAHATGVMGKRGEGCVSQLSLRAENVISIHTCGKALGAAGAFVACDVAIKEYLINKARSLIYTTALPPVVAVQVQESLDYLRTHGKAMVTELCERSAVVRTSLQKRLQTWTVPDGETPIIPVIVGSEDTALKAAEVLKDEGIYVSAIRPPTVPTGTSRLRLNISLKHSQAQLEQVVDLIASAQSKFQTVKA